MRELGIFYYSFSAAVLYLLQCSLLFSAVNSLKQVNESSNDGISNYKTEERQHLLLQRNVRDLNQLSAISVYGNLLVTITDSGKVLIVNSSENASTARTLSLSYLKLKKSLTQFKLLNESIIFINDESSCWICELVEGRCRKLPNVSSESFIPEAVLTPDGSVMVYAVSDDGDRSSGIFKFDLSSLSNNSTNEPIQYAPNQSQDQVHNVITGFNRHGFTYFVGSVNRTDLVQDQHLLSCANGCAVNTIRITRICDLDKTEDLLSRMDIPLSCSNLPENSNFVYKTGFYNGDNDRLITAVEDKNGRTTVCTFNMAEVSERFDNVWNSCQKVQTRSRATCQLDGFATFPHFPLTEKSSCSKYGLDKRIYTNCNLHEYNGTDARESWLEDFCPFNGTVFIHLLTNGSDLWMQQVYGDEALLIYIAADSSINRVAGTDFHWTKKLNLNNHLQIAADVKSKILFYTNDQKLKTAEYFERINISCKSLYNSCLALQRVGWTDPLKCYWCQRREGSFAFSNISEECDGTTYFKQCSIIKNENSINAESPLQSSTSVNTGFQQKSNRKKTRLMRAILGIACGIIFTTLICLIVWFFYRYSKKHPFEWQNGIEVGFSSPYKLPYDSNMCSKSNDYESNSNYQALFLEIDPKLQIRYDKLQLKEKIGEGNFGVVYKGIYKGDDESLEVACKTINTFDDPNHYKAVAEFLQEGLIMASLNHPHILRLIGISLTPNILPVIVSDYLPNGNLLQYISDSSNVLTYGQLLHFGIEIASGMEYIHRMNYIHRDLAARNCMLDSSFTIRISDFGLTRQVSGTGAYQVRNESRKIPFRWLPPESLNRGEFTKEGDVWAFGVVLWEMATRGCIPYGAYTDIKSTMDYLAAGFRLEKPRGCPNILYQGMMMKCWDAEPDNRPSFKSLIDLLEDAQKVFEKGVEIETKNP